MSPQSGRSRRPEAVRTERHTAARSVLSFRRARSDSRKDWTECAVRQTRSPQKRRSRTIATSHAGLPSSVTRPPSSDSAGYRRRCATYQHIINDTGAADSRKSTIGGRATRSVAAVSAARQPKPRTPSRTLLTDWTGGNVVPAGAGLVARSAQAGRDEVEPVHQGKMCPARRTPALRSVTSGGRVSGRRGRRAHPSPETCQPPDDMDEHSGRCGPRDGATGTTTDGRAHGWALSMIAPQGRGQPSNPHSGLTLLVWDGLHEIRKAFLGVEPKRQPRNRYPGVWR